jgi:hypothetical protein
MVTHFILLQSDALQILMFLLHPSGAHTVTAVAPVFTKKGAIEAKVTPRRKGGQSSVDIPARSHERNRYTENGKWLNTQCTSFIYYHHHSL